MNGQHPTTVADVFWRSLSEQGVEWVFANAGTDFAPLIESLLSLEEADVPLPQVVTALHESVAVGMAHGFYLATGRPQVAMVHVSVGTMNALVGLMNASRDEIPLLLAAGRTPISDGEVLGARDASIHWGQELFDQGGLVREVTKWDHELRVGHQMGHVIRRAFSLAMSEPRGPVYLSLPREILAERLEDDPSHSPDVRPIGPTHPNPDEVREVAERLLTAERPLIVASRGSRAIFERLGPFAEAIAAPVIHMAATRLAIPTDHPFFAGTDPTELLRDADFVLVLDAPVPWIPRRAQPDTSATVVQVGADALSASLPMRTFRADFSIGAGVCAFIDSLSECLAPDGYAEDDRTTHRREALRTQLAEARSARSQGAREATGSSAISKPYASRIIGDVFSDAIIVNEIGVDPSVMTFQRWDSYFGTSTAGGLGWGVPAALGASLADRDRLVVATVGDGSYVFANPSACHHTAAVLGSSLVTVVFANGRWNSVEKSALAMYPDGRVAAEQKPPLTSLGFSPDYTSLAAAYGCHGIHVTEAPMLEDALVEARKVAESGTQVLVSIVC